MNWLMTLFTALLFVVMIPGMFFHLPTGGSKKVVALTHGLIFALVYHFTHKAVWQYTSSMTLGLEGFEGCKTTCPCANGTSGCKDTGSCVCAK